jgi:tetratricopeptide (TPR) repeat protein
MLDVSLFGHGPAGPHVMNLLFHVANTLLLFVVLRRLTSAHWRSALVAALFALHPLHVESVAWISERKDVLSAFFFLLTLLAYGRYAQKKSEVRSQKSEARGVRDEVSSFKFQVSSGQSSTPNIQHPTRNSSLTTHNSPFSFIPDYCLALLFFVLGLMSKPMLVSVPFVLLLLDYWPLNRVLGVRDEVSSVRFQVSAGETSEAKTSAANIQHPIHNSQLITHHSGVPSLRRLILEKLPFFCLSAISCVVTFVAQQKSGAVISVKNLSAELRIENVFVSYARYLGKLVWPVKLVAPYPHPGHWPWLWIVSGIVLVLGLSVVAWQLRRNRPFFITGWFWFLGMLIPVIGLVQVGNQSLADRYTYLPLIGMLTVLIWGAAEAAGRWRLPVAAVWIGAGLLLCACGLRTMDQLRHWKDGKSLFRHALAWSDNNYVAHDNLSVCLYNEGKVDEAVEHCHQALRIEPNDVIAWINLGHGLSLKNRMREAIESFRRAVEVNPHDASAWSNLGGTLIEVKEYDEAVRCLETAVRLQPEFPQALNDLGGVFLLRKQFPEAVRCFEKALRFQPDYTRARANLAGALYQLGKADEAMDQFQAVLRLTPDDPVIHVFLAGILMDRGRIDEAMAHYTEALRLAPDDAETHYSLGCGLARSGRRNEAVVHLKEALRLKPDYPEAKQRLQALGAADP